MAEEAPQQVIPVTVLGVYVDGSYFGGVVSVGPVSFKTSSGFEYRKGKEYWWIQNSFQDLPTLFSDANDVTLKLLARSGSTPSQAVKDAASEVEQNATWELVDKSILAQSDWAKGNPDLPNTVCHFFFEDPSDPSSKYIRLAFATNANEPGQLPAVAWYAGTNTVQDYFGGNKVGDEKTLQAVQAGSGGGYPGPTPFYSHTTSVP